MKKNKILIVTLTLSLMLSIVGWSYSHDMRTNMHEVIVQKQDDIEKKSTEIARLDMIIQLKDETIVKQKKTIEEKVKNLESKDNFIKEKDAKINELSKKIKNNSVSRSNNSSTQGKAIAFKATAYTAYCNGCSGITSAGEDVRDSIYYNGYRIIAVDPSIIPMFSIVRINTGDKTFTAIALDTGGAIKGHKVDLLVNSKKEAWDFGVKPITVTVLKKGK